ncbi:MAG: protein kinase [Clostridia bacterium]|nr:protein kinase [Clostridia bacterium]
MDRYVGKRLDGRYEIMSVIGVGGMAVVYKARDIVDDRVVAVKILKDEYHNNEEFRTRFRTECKAIAVLSHPNIVKIYDVSFGDRLEYIVMEYVDGITLKEYVQQQGRVRWSEVVHFTLQILKALQHAHDKGIIHRDIKSQNIMLMRNGTIKVMDFGIARFNNLEPNGRAGEAIGSVHYISPEQARGEMVDERSDIYSVGIIMYEMLSGRLPFDGDNTVAIAIKQMESQPASIREQNPTVPEGLEEITMKAIAKDKNSRYQSAATMIADIEKFKSNPNIRFNYKYFVDETPTRFVSAAAAASAEKQAEKPKMQNQPTRPAPVNQSKSADGRTVQRTAQPVRQPARQPVRQPAKQPVKAPARQPVKQQPSRQPQAGRPAGKSDTKGKKRYVYYDDDEYDRPKRRSILPLLAAVLACFILFGTVCVVYIDELTGIFTQDQKTVEVPKLVGMLLRDANEKYSDSLIISVMNEQFSADYPEGTILQQSRTEGQKVAKLTTIQVVVSKGTKGEKVPDVYGQTENDARTAVSEAGFVVQLVGMGSNDVAEGCVIKTEPERNTSFAEGQTVIVFISTGPIKNPMRVPNVIGLKENDAKALIEESGLKYSKSIQKDSDKPQGEVIGVAPGEGETVEKGSTVTLIISNEYLIEKNVTIDIPLPSKAKKSVYFKIYQDDQLIEQTNAIDPSDKTYSLSISGSGEGAVRVTISAYQDSSYSEYILYYVNYTTGKVRKTSSYNYVEPKTPESEDGQQENNE